jgi:hypothetical protein
MAPSPLLSRLIPIVAGKALRRAPRTSAFFGFASAKLVVLEAPLGREAFLPCGVPLIQPNRVLKLVKSSPDDAKA